jgi:hypothetical protein
MTNRPLTWEGVNTVLITFYHISASTFLIIMGPATTIQWYLLGTYTILVGQTIFYVGAALWLITGLIDLSLMVSRLIRHSK